MAGRDQEPYVIDNIRGFYSREVTRENVPPGYLITGRNLIYIDKSAKTRDGFSVTTNYTKNIIRQHFFRLSTAPTVQRSIILDNLGNFFDPAVSLVTPIWTDATNALDFSILPQFDRVYISMHNRVRGLANLLVYEPLIATVAREAGGNVPVLTMVATTSATPGVVQAGKHLIAVAYETTSGYITQPSYHQSGPYEAPGGFAIDLTNIPTGGPEVAKRHILVSKRIPSYDGNDRNYEIFFIAQIDDNVTTSLTIDFVDSQLVDSGDFLADQLAPVIPGFVQMCTYQGCVIGVGEIDNPSIARVSKPGEPESFSASEGFVIVNPGEGGGLKNCIEYRNTLVLYKSFKTYSTINNGGPPNTWPVTEIDSSLGTECFGIGKLFDDPGGVTNDAVVVATRGGLYAFDGSYASKPLSYVIETEWANRSFINFAYTQVFVDPINKIIYLSYFDSVTLQNSADYKLLTLDYSDGLNWETVRWSSWLLQVEGGVDDSYEVRSIGINFNSDFLPVFVMITFDNLHQTNFYSLNAVVDPVSDVPGFLVIQPVNPNNIPSYKLYQGGKFVSEGLGTVQVNGDETFNIPDTNLPGPTPSSNGATYSYLRNVRTDYITESFLMMGPVSINKIVLYSKDDLDEISK